MGLRAQSHAAGKTESQTQRYLALLQGTPAFAIFPLTVINPNVIGLLVEYFVLRQQP